MSKAPVKTHQIPSGPQVRVYDNGGATLDRYTVVIDGEDWDHDAGPGLKSMLGLNAGGRGISQFTDGQEGPHLGKRIEFSELDEETQEHIIARLQPDATS